MCGNKNDEDQILIKQDDGAKSSAIWLYKVAFDIGIYRK